MLARTGLVAILLGMFSLMDYAFSFIGTPMNFGRVLLIMGVVFIFVYIKEGKEL